MNPSSLRTAAAALLAIGALHCSSSDSSSDLTHGGAATTAGASVSMSSPGSSGNGGSLSATSGGAGTAGAATNGASAGTSGAPESIAWVETPASHVDTLVGTTNIQNNFRGANLFPGADFPFGMVQWSPDTMPTRPSGGGYDYKNTDLIGFSLTHISGPGCSGALGDIPILPLTGGLPSGDLNAVKQTLTHTGEVGTAGYYSVQSGTPPITTELTATLHSAMARFTFPATNAANLLFKLRDSANGNDKFGDSTATIASNTEVSGSTASGGFCGTGTPYVLYFDIVFDQPFSDSKIIAAPGKSMPGFVFLTFDATKSRRLQAKVGISFVSVANARGNWMAESSSAQWSFDATQAAAVKQWNATLSQVQISGGSDTEQGLFYTALYHSLLHPNVATDTNGQYMGFDKKVHTVSGAQKEQYVNYSGWDTYRTQSQLAAVVAPKAMSDSAQSMLNDAAQSGGRLPRWSLEYGENGIMPGDPADGILAGYYAFGAKDFDTAAALTTMVEQANTANGIRDHLDDYLSYGYVPDDVGHDQAGGLSLELYQADFAISQFAAALGDNATAKTMLARSQNWQSLFDASVNMFIPKRKDGTFAPGVGLSSSHGLTEGDASQYRWAIPLNRKAQFTAMGGVSVSGPALDAFFSKLDDYEGPCALFTNEFELGAQFWGNHSSEPWRTQDVSNRIRTTVFHQAPGFLNDNEDLGSMSASLVWAMLGVYPSYPGSAILSISSPEFSHERIHLPSGASLTLHATNASTTSPYVQSLLVDGQAKDQTWLDASVIQSGATLDFVLGALPNKSWGTNSADPLEAAGQEYVSAFLYATPNPLVLPAKGSADLTLFAKSARSDSAQKVSWTVSANGFSFSTSSGSFDLPASGKATSKLTVTAPATPGSFTVSFKMTSTLGVSPPTYVLPVTVK